MPFPGVRSSTSDFTFTINAVMRMTDNQEPIPATLAEYPERDRCRLMCDTPMRGRVVTLEPADDNEVFCYVLDPAQRDGGELISREDLGDLLPTGGSVGLL